MKSLKLLTAAFLATLSVSAMADPFGAACPAGAAPGTAGCPATGMRGAAMLERLKAADKNADGMISRDEAQASLPRVFANFDAIDANHDGLITLQEMKDSMAARHGHRLAKMFAKLDANGDGKLTRAEVAAAPRLLANFDAIDSDHDGSLSLTEIQTARRAQRAQRVAAKLKSLDANGDGLISRDEFTRRLAARFDAIDANHDGFLSAEERQAARKNFAFRGR